jgi:hypothetical protein
MQIHHRLHLPLLFLMAFGTGSWCHARSQLVDDWTQMQNLGKFQVGGSTAHKLIVTPEEGIELPMILFSPASESKPNGTASVGLCARLSTLKPAWSCP